MPRILRDLPFYADSSLLTIPGGPTLTILSDQIIVWVSVTRPDVAEPPPHIRPFPAVHDTGYNRGFLIQEQQLIDWAGGNPAQLPQLGWLRVEQRRIPLRDAIVWLHRNRTGRRDEFTGELPFNLDLDQGIGVWPADVPGARRLPLLGVQALRLAGLQMPVDFREGRLSLRTPRRWWWF